MTAMSYSLQHKAFVKECPSCSTIFIGHIEQDAAERELSKFFAQDRKTADGFYGRCRTCVSRKQRATRNGRVCDPEILLKEQDGRCGICDNPITFARTIENAKVTAYVDHDHTTGKVRGILCPGCNSLLAIVDDFQWLRRALTYLLKHGKVFKWPE